MLSIKLIKKKKNKEVIKMVDGKIGHDAFGKMSEGMKRNMMERDTKVEFLKKKIAEKKIGHIVSGMGHG